MSNNNWYTTENWYEPREPVAAIAAMIAADATGKKRRRKRGLKPLHVVGLIALVIVLIVGTSLAFAGTGRSAGPAHGGGSGDYNSEMPGDWRQFFDSYYESTNTNTAKVDIPRAETPIDFKLSLLPQEGEELSLQEIYADCSSSIVAICGYIDGMIGYNWGTGIILSADGLVLTNTHVIDGCDEATVTLFDDSVYEAKLVGADSVSDVAVLKIEASDLPAATFGESAALTVGDRVAAIGNPLGEEFRSTLTDGIISAIERGVNYNGRSMTLLQTNTALNEGNSGGALFNMYGQVIGITNMKMMSSYSSIEGIGFAIPSSTVQEVVDALVSVGVVRGRPSIGITVGAIPSNASEYYELPEGLYISAVSEGSDAEAKGIQAGDIILEVNGVPVSTTDQVNDIKNELEVGDTMSFTIWREGETLEMDVMLMDTNDVYK